MIVLLAALAQADEGPGEDVLVLGGRLYLRLDGGVAEEVDPDYPVFSSPNLLGLFADVRPDERLRAYASARIIHDFTVEEGDVDPFGVEKEPTTVELDQLWLKGDVAQRLYVTVGRQRIKWGSGHFWNPTDFLNTRVRKPLEIYDERAGVSLVKLHLPVGASNFYALADLEGASRPGELGGAGRAELVAGLAELAFTGAIDGDEGVQLGADVSAGVGPLDVHVEGAVRHGDTGPFWKGTLDFASRSVPEEDDRTADWIPQMVAGAELGIPYSGEDTVYVGLEYFWNDAGYADADLYPWLLLEGGYVPFYVGRHYGGAYLHLPEPWQLDDTSFTASWIGNFSDGSHLARLDVRWTVLTHLSLHVYGAGHFGEAGEFHFSLDVPPIPGVLDEAISVEQPPVDLGIGANLEF